MEDRITITHFANGDVPVRLTFLDCGAQLGLAWKDAEGKHHAVKVALPAEWLAHLKGEFIRRHVIVGEDWPITGITSPKVGKARCVCRAGTDPGGGSSG